MHIIMLFLPEMPQSIPIFLEDGLWLFDVRRDSSPGIDIDDRIIQVFLKSRGWEVANSVAAGGDANALSRMAEAELPAVLSVAVHRKFPQTLDGRGRNPLSNPVRPGKSGDP